MQAITTINHLSDVEVICVFGVTLFKTEDIALHQSPEEQIPLQRGMYLSKNKSPGGFLALVCVFEPWHVQRDNDTALL